MKSRGRSATIRSSSSAAKPGRGKTTQLPKICIAAGRGERGLIGHTQPRRIAARAVATRIAQELAPEPERSSATRCASPTTRSPTRFVKLMTDGILLAETQGDPLLAAYDTIIIDEAHERSLNIDFLLGYLKQPPRPKRPDLKVIITSATLDADRFARHFGSRRRRPAPVIEVSGRMYPVEVRYRPLARGRRRGRRRGGARGRDRRRGRGPLAQAVRATSSCFFPASARSARRPRSLSKGLARRPYARGGRDPSAVRAPLGAGAAARVRAVVAGGGSCSRPTSPRPRSPCPASATSIDAGLARVKRYSVRNKTTLLQIEKISQASANQRAGRCGRRRRRHLRAPLRRGRLRRAAEVHRTRRSCGARSRR